jgi:hypothetical protein
MSGPTSAVIGSSVRSEATAPAAVVDPRAVNAVRDPLRFAALAGQLALLLGVFALMRVEEGGFFRMAGVAFAAFLVHYWLPFSAKEPWWILTSLAGAVLLLGMPVVLLLVICGLVFYGVAVAPMPYRWRLGLVLVLAAAMVYGRATNAWSIPWQFWPVAGAVFMFRLMIYMYDLRFAKKRPSLQEFFAYFFPLPNFYFLLFPVIDLQTLRRTYYQRDIHAIAQQGIEWMVRGTIHLALYRLIYHLKPSFSPVEVTSLPSLALGMVAIYLLYLRVSGQFHIIVGLIHLFGYDLPETHRRYLLASSLTDFWRRINIYWKDFMVKLVYFPIYFKLRRSGDTRAQVVATAGVFLATWALHSYQWFWLRGDVLFTWPDSLFWAILGALVIVNVLMERKRPAGQSTKDGRIVHAMKVAGTFTFIVVLWSLWNTPTLGEWTEIVTWWRVG